jgi:predicted RND superfamily exporter protein
LHRIIYRFHKHILVLTLLLTVLAIILTTQIKLDLNFFSLLPADNPSVNAFFEISQKIGFQSLLIAIVEVPPNLGRQNAESLLDILATNLAKSQMIEEVEYKSEDLQLSSLFRTYLAHLPLFLNESDLKKLISRFSEEGIRKQVRKNKRLLMAPFSLGAKDLIFNDPLGLRDLLEPNILVTSGKQPLRAYHGYYHSRGGEAYFLFIRPTRPPQYIPFSRKLMAEVRSIEKTSLSQFSRQLGNKSEKIRISYTGGYPIAVNDETMTKRDIKLAILTSFLGVMVLFGLCFRTPRILFYVGTPLAISIIWTLGFARVAFHHLNILTFIFSCVLIGLGIDFAIHIVNRYFGHEKIGLDVPHRLRQTFQQAGMGLIIGGVTTSTAFYSIAISHFRGFRELGILTGSGIMFCLLVMIFVLPSILVYFSSEKTFKGRISVTGFGLKPFLNSLQKHPRAVLIVSLTFLCLLAISGTKVRFDDNLRNFRPADEKLFRLQDQVTDWLGGSTAQIILVAKGKSEAEVMETNHAIYKALEDLMESDVIAGVKSTAQYFLPPSQQRRNAEFIFKHPDVFDMKRVESRFKEALEENDFEKMDLYDGYFESLSNALSREKPLLLSSLRKTQLYRLLKHFVFQENEHFRIVTYVIPPKDLWSQADTAQLKQAIIRKLEKEGIKKESYNMTGANLLAGDLKELIIHNMRSALWLAGLSAVLVLLIYYRRLKFLALSTLPIFVGVVTLFGVMVVFHFDFNFFNLIVLPMIIGIGIDDGVHLTNTFRRVHRADMSDAMSQTGRAVVLTSLTTLVGFGSLSLSHYPGLKSMGYVAIIGISACLLASLIVLPAIFFIIGHPSQGKEEITNTIHR